MSHTDVRVQLVALLIFFCLVFLVFNTCYIRSFAMHELPEPITYNEIIYKSDTSKLITYLRENGWVKDSVTDEKLEYILLLIQQLTGQFDVRPSASLITAMVAVESRFDTNCEYLGARGLMQLLPMYHEDRLIQYLEEDEPYSRNLFYNERLNLMTGIDYMDYIMGAETEGSVHYALMWYNQGAVSACDDFTQGYISNYSKTIVRLTNELNDLLLN